MSKSNGLTAAEGEQRMLVSIIVPVFNTKIEVLRHCLDSIFSQTYEEIEIVLVDDGSNLDYADDIDRLSYDDRLKVFHKSNEGVSVARNYGVKVSKGDYILFVDSDDILVPYAVESGIEIIRRTSADVVIGRINQTDYLPQDENARAHLCEFEILDSFEKIRDFEAHVFLKNIGKWGRDEFNWMFNGEGCWAHLISKKIALRIPFVRGLEISEDTIWALQMLEIAKTGEIVICLDYSHWYYYVQNEYSVMHGFNPRICEQIIKPFEILNSFSFENDNFLAIAYKKWILVKLKQLMNRFFLSKECELSYKDKKAKMEKLLSFAPFREAITDSKDINVRIRLKLFLFRNNLALPFYVWKSRIESYINK